MTVHLYASLAGFIALAAIAECAERAASRGAQRAHTIKHGALIAWCCHPSVVRGFHDLGIYVVAEAPKFVGFLGH